MDRAEAGRLIGFDPAVGPDAPPDHTHSPECRPDPAVTWSAQNLRALGQMAQRFSNEDRGRLPRDLGTLYAASDGDPALLVNPRGATPPPPAGLTREQKALYADAGSDYVYVGRGLNYTAPAEVVIAYENPAEMKDGINLLFADGRVEFREMRWAAEAIRRSMTYPRGWWA
jgi:prepilin-type processing-associated H-X9-DG protein